jgi:hypothetical protein
MKIALLSFALEAPEDPLGDRICRSLQQVPDLQLIRETMRPDLARLKGLLLAALTDPRFDAILVAANLPGRGNEQLQSQVESSLQQALPAWQPLVAQTLWPHIGSEAIWSHGCLGRSQRRLLAALTGGPEAQEAILQSLLIPQLPRLVEWAQG